MRLLATNGRLSRMGKDSVRNESAPGEYLPLRSYVAKRGGVRLAARSALRDKIIAMCVDEFPTNCPTDKNLEVLRARVSVRLKREYGTVVTTVLSLVIANFIARLVWEWWTLRDSHRVLMAGWQQRAKETKAGKAQ